MAIFRPNIIDVEASGFGVESYPIEIGFVMGTGDRYSTLIRPPDPWIHWDDRAEEIHNISRDLLIQHGKSVVEVANGLNAKLRGETVYSDGWVVDKPWISKLFYTAKLPQLFSLSPLELILTEEQMEVWHQVKKEVIEKFKVVRHRASMDAFIIQETYVRSRK